MGLPAQDVIQEDTVGGQLGLLGQETAHLGRVERKDFWPDPGGGAGEFHLELLGALLEFAGPGQAGVLVGA